MENPEKDREIFVALREDRAVAMVQISAADQEPDAHVILEPSELSIVIAALGGIRANMTDPVPHDLGENPVFKDVTHDPVFATFKPNGSARIVLAARHPGFGWLAFTLDRDTVKRLLGALVAATQGGRHHPA